MRGRGRLIGVGGVLALVSACGEDELEVAQVAELCGVAGPVRVLEHAADETIYYRHQRIGERLFFSVGPSEALADVLPYNSVVGEEMWTTGLCGESPERLDRRYRRFFVSDRWPDVALVCGDGNVSSLSAGGPLDVHVVFPATGCDATWTQHGLVMPDRSDGLDFLPYPDDPRTETAARIKLPVSVAVRGAGAEPVISAAGDGVLVLQADGELVYVDLRDRSVTGVRTGVGDFLASPSGRYVLWRGVAPGDDDGTIVGPQTLVLEDRGTGTSVALGEGYLSEDSLRWGDQGHLILYETDAVRLYRLPDLASSALPQGYRLARSSAWQPVDPLLDGRWIVSSEKGSSLHYFDPATGALDPLFTRASQVLGRDAGATLVLAVYECCDIGTGFDEGAVWYVPDDGSDATRIAGRSTLFGWRPRADALISVVDIDTTVRGRLVQIDVATQQQMLIDTRVYPVAGMGRGDDPDIVRYSVQDGARSGVWQVRLAE